MSEGGVDATHSFTGPVIIVKLVFSSSAFGAHATTRTYIIYMSVMEPIAQTQHPNSSMHIDSHTHTHAHACAGALAAHLDTNRGGVAVCKWRSTDSEKVVVN